MLLPSTPENPHFLLSRAEREAAVRRSRATHNPEDPKFRFHSMHTALLEVRFWLLALGYALGHYNLASLSSFSPVIILGFGYSVINSQLMSVVVYACALVSTIFFARVADKTKRRGIPLLVCTIFAFAGYIVLLLVNDNHARMAATCLVAFGLYPMVPLTGVWMATNIAGYTKRGVALATMNMIAQAVGIAVIQAYRDPPLYHTGIASSLGVVVAQALITIVSLWIIKIREPAEGCVQSLALCTRISTSPGRVSGRAG